MPTATHTITVKVADLPAFKAVIAAFQVAVDALKNIEKGGDDRSGPGPDSFAEIALAEIRRIFDEHGFGRAEFQFPSTPEPDHDSGA